MIELVRQLILVLLGVATMASIMAVLTGAVTAAGPGHDTTQWGLVAVAGIVGLTLSLFAYGALSG